MTLFTPHPGRVRTQHNLGTAASDTFGVSVTTSGTATVKGTPVELIAATSFDAYWVTVWARNMFLSGTDSQCALDILTGAATEDIWIPNLLAGACGGAANAGTWGKTWNFPLYLPAGTRVAAQAAGNRLTQAFQVGVILSGGHGMPHHRVGRKVTTYGMGTVPSGTAITYGDTTVGAYAQMTASTSEDHFAFLPSIQLGSDTNVNGHAYFTQLGVGAATEDMVGTWIYTTESNEQCNGPINPTPIFLDVPSGTRLSLRGAAAVAIPDTMNGVIHAVS